MMKREVSTELDLSDHHALLDAMQETAKLRVELTNRWINEERLVGYLDTNRDGKIDYDEFYDELSQFGITEVIDVDKVFAFVDKTKKGYVSIPEMLAALRLRDGDVEETEGVQQEDDEDVEDFMAFPDTLLVALVAHNNMKPSMMKFVKDNLKFFKSVNLVTTGSTGRALTGLGLTVDTLVSSGPLGGDQEIGGMIARGQVAAVFFFTDPLSSHPHEADIIALNRICCVHDTMFANNPSTAQALIYALEYSAVGFSRLMGENPNQKKDSKIVEDYKTNQQKVISNVQGGATSPNGRSSLILNRRQSVLSNGRSSLGLNGRGRRSSILRAPTQRSSLLSNSQLSINEE